jgi:hypothetical protein
MALNLSSSLYVAGMLIALVDVAYVVLIVALVNTRLQQGSIQH